MGYWVQAVNIDCHAKNEELEVSVEEHEDQHSKILFQHSGLQSVLQMG
jgi:hypothetical protein